MNTPAHLIFGAAAFARHAQPAVTSAAIFGALLPDLSLYLLVFWALVIDGLSAEVVFGRLYFSDLWQGIFAVDNSFVLWGFVLVLGLWFRARLVTVFAASGLLHILFDFLLHHDDARRHFWPASDWVFVSPVSYWDPSHFGNIAGPVEVAVSLLLCLVLWHRFRSVTARALITLAALAEAAPPLIFGFLFMGS